MKKILCTINVHSFIDIITNSSTEIFVSGIEKTEAEIHQLLNQVKSEFGCSSCVEFEVERHYDNDGEEVEGKFDISYEQYREPCTKMVERIKEVFGINN